MSSADAGRDAEMDLLANQIAGVCVDQHSTIVLGALFSLAFQIIANSPDRGYALACVNFLEKQARIIK
jgi:hypothetical protein